MALALILAVFVALYLTVSVITILKVKQSIAFTPNEKHLQYLLILAIPFLWAFVANGLMTTNKGSHEAEKEIEPPTTRFFEGEGGL